MCELSAKIINKIILKFFDCIGGKLTGWCFLVQDFNGSFLVSILAT